MEAIRFVINAVIGILATLVSIPLILVGTICIFGGKPHVMDWCVENSPLNKWFNHLGI